MTTGVVTALKERYWAFLERQKQAERTRAQRRLDASVRKTQARLLKNSFPRPDVVTRLIVFLAPGRDEVNGGIMSIVSLYEETRRLTAIHGAEVILCTLPSDRPLSRYTKFPNAVPLYGFFDVLSHFRDAQHLLVHVPEYAIERYFHSLTPRMMTRLHTFRLCHNVMLQNINLVRFDHFGLLRDVGDLTCTTAHRAYSGPETAEAAQCPVHLFSVFISPEKYQRAPYAAKSNLMIVSPDPHPARTMVLSTLQQEIPDLTVRIIQNLSYEEYKDLIVKAKWSLTFGEGLDGYFIETIFSGGISLAVYNKDFFTADFGTLPTLFSSYTSLALQLADTLEGLDNEQSYNACQHRQHALCCAHYDYNRYVANIASYYRKYWPLTTETVTAHQHSKC